MRNRRTRILSDEEKRNLKVDPRRIPQWEKEIDSIKEHFNILDTSSIIDAAQLICEVRKQSSYYMFIDDIWKLEKAIQQLRFIPSGAGIIDTDFVNLVRLHVNHNNNVKIIEHITNKLKAINFKLDSMNKCGTTSSFIMSLVTGKTHLDYYNNLKKEKLIYESLNEKIPQINSAVSCIDIFIKESEKYITRYCKVKALLSKAADKKAALERFDNKHGNAFAKAAAVDKTTRSLAGSLKRIVTKTENCPYCGKALGDDPHLDHIYPVAKGGLSIKDNLVWCCSSCNSLKSDRSLIIFLTDIGVEIPEVLSRLQNMGKHI
mgnify:CR=1 FL=1